MKTVAFVGLLGLFAALPGCVALDAMKVQSEAQERAAKPEAGPEQISDESAYAVIAIDSHVARVTRDADPRAVAPDFISAAPLDFALISIGDRLSVTITGAPGAGKGAKPKPPQVFEGVEVDELGQAHIPQIGFLDVAGKTPGQAREALMKRLGGAASLDVAVRRETPAAAGRISVAGAVGKPGVYALERGVGALLGAVARAGGAQGDERALMVVLRRGGQTARLPLADALDDPRYDLALRPGDTLTIERDRRGYMLLGAARRPGRRAFDGPTPSLLDALGEAEGGEAGDDAPTALMVFRFERPAVAAALHSRSRRAGDAGASDLVGGIAQRPLFSPAIGGQEGAPVVYRLDLSAPDALFLARGFALRDQDAVLITTRSLSDWASILGVSSSDDVRNTMSDL